MSVTPDKKKRKNMPVCNDEMELWPVGAVKALKTKLVDNVNSRGQPYYKEEAIALGELPPQLAEEVCFVPNGSQFIT